MIHSSTMLKSTRVHRVMIIHNENTLFKMLFGENRIAPNSSDISIILQQLNGQVYICIWNWCYLHQCNARIDMHRVMILIHLLALQPSLIQCTYKFNTLNRNLWVYNILLHLAHMSIWTAPLWLLVFIHVYSGEHIQWHDTISCYIAVI